MRDGARYAASMGLRIRFRVAPRAALERAASSTLAGTASTVGWRFAVTDVRGEAALVARGVADLVLFRDSVPGVSLEAVPDLTLRDLATRSTRALEMVLRALEGAPWPGVRLVQEGYRRWWVGGIAHVAAGQHMREALRGDLEHLGRLAALAPVGVAWLDTAARDDLSRGGTSGPIFGAPLVEAGHLFAELQPERIELLLAWAATVERWIEPPRIGAGRAEDPDVWHAYVARHVALLREVSPDQVVLVSMG